MVLEMGSIVLLWFRETRIPTLIAIVGFHVSIDASMNLNSFHWIMLVGWCSFLLQPDDLTKQLAFQPIFQSIGHRWNTFFYSRTTNLKAAVLVRTSCSLVIFVNVMLLSLDFEYFMKVMPTQEARKAVAQDCWTILAWLPEEKGFFFWHWVILYTWMVQTVLLGLGVAPRFQAFCSK